MLLHRQCISLLVSPSGIPTKSPTVMLQRLDSYNTLTSVGAFCSIELALSVLVSSQPIALLGPRTPPNEVNLSVIVHLDVAGVYVGPSELIHSLVK